MENKTDVPRFGTTKTFGNRMGENWNIPTKEPAQIYHEYLKRSKDAKIAYLEYLKLGKS